MSKQIKAQPMNRKTDVRVGARDMLLAGVGAASLLRKNAGKYWSEATAIARRIPAASSILAEGIGERSQAFRDELIERANALGERANTAAGELVADVESRLRPLLRKFDDTSILLGIKIARKQPMRAAKLTKRRKAVAKPTVRKPRKAA